MFTVTYLALLSAAVCWSYGRADGRRDAASVASYLRFKIMLGSFFVVNGQYGFCALGMLMCWF